MKTAEDFKRATGVDPIKDDLDRANCPDAGRIGHAGCGWCKHDKPTQFCRDCMVARMMPGSPP
jgi:hypothetical protein